MTLLRNIQNLSKAFLLLSIFLISFQAKADYNIAITQIVDHPSLNAIREGILKELAAQGFVEGQNTTIIYENAQGNPATAVQIAQKFEGMPLDIIIPISTPSTQPIVKHSKDTPVVFAAITDPVSAKIVSSLEHPEGNVTGVADIPPLEEQLRFIETCVPDLKTLGVVYNPGEVNSVVFLEGLRTLAQDKNIRVITAPALKSSEVQTAAKNLITKVDAIFIGNDNTVVSGLEPLVKTCLEAKVPLFASDPDSVDRGALAAYAYDQRLIGRQVGSMAAKILNGEKPRNLPVERPHHLKASINSDTAEALKVTCALATQPEEKK